MRQAKSFLKVPLRINLGPNQLEQKVSWDDERFLNRHYKLTLNNLVEQPDKRSRGSSKKRRKQQNSFCVSAKS